MTPTMTPTRLAKRQAMTALDYPGRFLSAEEIAAEAADCHRRCRASWCQGPEDHSLEAIANLRERDEAR